VSSSFTLPPHQITYSICLSRFIGGLGNMVMVEAMSTLSPPSSGEADVSQGTGLRSGANLHEVELPWFAKGGRWPELPYIPTADALPRPPRTTSDLLIHLYFDRINPLFPIICQPDFMRRYSATSGAGGSRHLDTGFSSVFFAVCACASGLLPRESEVQTSFTGLKYYESALLLNVASTGQGSLQQVQCWALLSLCTAGWNTLAQSWKFAGSAVRAAQDLGLHVSRHQPRFESS